MRELVKLNKTSDIMRVVLSIFADATRAFARGERKKGVIKSTKDAIRTFMIKSYGRSNV